MEWDARSNKTQEVGKQQVDWTTVIITVYYMMIAINFKHILK